MNLSIGQIDTSNRGRKEFSGIEELAESIKAHRIIHPIVVDQTSDGKYILIAGERRLRACLVAGIVNVPVTLRKDTSPVEIKCLELEENVQREDLHWSERCEILRQLDEIKRQQFGSSVASRAGSTDGWTREKMAQLTRRSVGSVSEEIKAANDLLKNPKLAKKVKHLPKKMAIKKLNVLLEEEKLKRAHPGGIPETVANLTPGPCEKRIKELLKNSVDLLITDPPYECETMNAVGDGSFGAGYGADKTNMSGARSMHELYDELFPELYRVLKPGAHCYIFHAMESNHWLKMKLRSLDFTVDDMPIIWSKQRMTTMPSNWHYRPCYEPILFAIKNPRERPLMTPTANIIVCPPINLDKRIHPLQKPRELLKTFIENSSSIGDVVLDCFAGSASTLKVAVSLHRKAIGFELDQGNFLRALKYLEKGS